MKTDGKKRKLDESAMEKVTGGLDLQIDLYEEHYCPKCKKTYKGPSHFCSPGLDEIVAGTDPSEEEHVCPKCGKTYKGFGHDCGGAVLWDV